MLTLKMKTGITSMRLEQTKNFVIYKNKNVCLLRVNF